MSSHASRGNHEVFGNISNVMAQIVPSKVDHPTKSPCTTIHQNMTKTHTSVQILDMYLQKGLIICLIFHFLELLKNREKVCSISNGSDCHLVGNRLK